MTTQATNQRNLLRTIVFLREHSICYTLVDSETIYDESGKKDFKAEFEIGKCILLYQSSFNQFYLRLYTENAGIFPIDNETDLSLLFAPEIIVA